MVSNGLQHCTNKITEGTLLWSIATVGRGPYTHLSWFVRSQQVPLLKLGPRPFQWRHHDDATQNPNYRKKKNSSLDFYFFLSSVLVNSMVLGSVGCFDFTLSRLSSGLYCKTIFSSTHVTLLLAMIHDQGRSDKILHALILFEKCILSKYLDLIW